MYFTHISIGGGISGLETIICAFNEIKNKLIKSKILREKFKFKKFTFAIIEKKPENIPGGVAYGFKNSKYGYFNNPIRLSPERFSDWVLKKENKNIIVEYLKIHGGYTGKRWLNNNNKVLFSSNLKKLKELYIPRAILNLWMEERLIATISEMKSISKRLSISFQIKFYKGEVIAIKEYQKKASKMTLKNDFCEELNYKIIKRAFKKLSFKNTRRRKKSIFSITQNIGLGLPPPKQLASPKAQKNNNYIWDYYSQGSTDLLVKKVLNLCNKKKKIKVYFIGYKAGLLESLPEIREIILRKKINIEITCSSKNLEGMQSAKLSLNKKKYKLKVLNKKNLHKIKLVKKLYLYILKEFEMAITTGYKKYDAWTQILENNVLNKCIKNLNIHEKKQYFDIYHKKIRNITRFTYSETIAAKEQLYQMGILKIKKEVVNKVEVLDKKLIVKAKNAKNKKIINNYDIVVNVSGPLNAETIFNEIPLVKSLKNKGAKTKSGGFLVDENFGIIGIKNAYVPGILARGFNHDRRTIINAILENSRKIGQGIAKTSLYNI